MDPRPIFVLVALALVVIAADPPAPRLIDFNPWAWIPTSRNRSPSIMDYFFPPSRTPKHSVLDPPADRTPPATTISQPSTSYKTTPEMLTTTSTRQASTAGKSKSTVPASDPLPTVTIPPKTKKHSLKTSAPPQTTIEVKKISQKTSAAPETTLESKTTQALKTEKTGGTTTTKVTYASSTARPTKRYTIRPIIKDTDRPTVTESDSTSNTEESDSTETLAMTGSTDTTGSSDTTFTGSEKDTGPTLSTVAESRSTGTGTGGTTMALETSTTTPDAAEAPDSREGYLPLRDKPQQNQVIINDQTKKETVPLPAGSTSVLTKPTKYHYYPHNQHLYYLPECAIQQVCNAVYVRLNYTQPLCACPSRYGNPCSASLNTDDGHTLRLTSSDSKKKYAHKAVTLVKTCEAVTEVRDCRTANDWSLLALQNIRTGKSHYLVLCRCPESSILEGPKSHDQPSYASIPGIRVFGMMCVNPVKYNLLHTKKTFVRVTKPPITTSSYKVDYTQPHFSQDKPEYNRFTSHSYVSPNYYNRISRVARVRRMTPEEPPFPWYKVTEFVDTLDLDRSL